MPYASRAPVAPSPSFFFFWKVRPGRCVVLMLRLVVARLICWPKCLSVNSCDLVVAVALAGVEVVDERVRLAVV